MMRVKASDPYRPQMERYEANFGFFYTNRIFLKNHLFMWNIEKIEYENSPTYVRIFFIHHNNGLFLP